MARERVLIVDDDALILRFLQVIFKDAEYRVLIARDGLEALDTVEKEMPDIVILDISMPKLDGLQVCRRLRDWSQLPIIILSARADTEGKVKCLEAGADDYVCNPFSKEELLARVSSVLRRSKGAPAAQTQSVFTAGDLTIDFNARRVTSAGEDVKLTPTEYHLLHELVSNVGKALDHTYLLKMVWGSEYSEEMEYLRVFVNRLRTKLEPDPSNPRYIITIPGMGYMFERRSID